MKWIVLMILMCHLDANAINCALAKLSSEKAICHSKILLDLDSQLNFAYKQQLGLISEPSEKTEFKRNQINWVKANEPSCQGDESCLVKRFQTQVSYLKSYSANVQAAHSEVRGGLQAKIIKAQKDKPYTANLSYPEISGTPPEAVQFLNHWITENGKRFGQCNLDEISADSVANADIQYNLTVDKLNDQVAAFTSRSLNMCGTPSLVESNDSTIIDIKAQKIYDLWAELSGKQKQNAIAVFIKDLGEIEDECKKVMSAASLKALTFIVGFDGKTQKFSISPRLDHFASAICATSDEFDLKQMRDLFSDNSKVLELLKAFEK